MNLEQINTLILDDIFCIILKRVVDFSSIPKDEVPFSFSDEGLSTYDRLIVHNNVIKPTLEALEADFLIYQESLRIEEQERLDEIDRTTALRVRWDALYLIDPGHPEFFQVISNESNAHKYMKNLIYDKSLSAEVETLMQALEAQSAELVAIAEVKKVKKDRRDLGKKARSVCEDVLDTITGYNISRSWTTEQINQLKVTFSEVKSYLSDGQPWAAKALIEAIEPDGVTITEAIKQDILDEFANSGLAGL